MTSLLKVWLFIVELEQIRLVAKEFLGCKFFLKLCNFEERSS